MKYKPNHIPLEGSLNTFDYNNIDVNHCIYATSAFPSWVPQQYSTFEKNMHFFYNPHNQLIHIVQNLNTTGFESLLTDVTELEVVFQTSLPLFNQYTEGKKEFIDIVNKKPLLYVTKKSDKKTYKEDNCEKLFNSLLGKQSNIQESIHPTQITCLAGFMSNIEKQFLSKTLKNPTPSIKSKKL